MASIPYGLYKIYTNGIPYIQVLPAYNVSGQFAPISPQEAQQIMQDNPNFYKNSGTADLINQVISNTQQGKATPSDFSQAYDPLSGQNVMAISDTVDSSGNEKVTQTPQQLGLSSQAPTPSGSVVQGANAPSQAGSSASAAPGSTGAGGGGFTQFVKSPNDNTVYGVTSNGQYVGFESWDQLLAANGGQAPQIGTISSSPASSVNYSQYSQSSGGQNFTPTGDPTIDNLLKVIQSGLDKLIANGQVINPNVTITPDQLAAFAKEASDQLHPYYATQLQAATDSYLTDLGYNVQQLNNQIAQAQTTYGRNLETLGSNSADQGFALSGIRQKQEGQLATDTQNNLDQARNSLVNSSTNAARSFAQQYGGLNVPNAPQIGAAPRVLPGQSQFDTSGGNTGLYTLNPDIYNKLIGTQANEEKSATDTLASQLASNSQQLQTNQQSRSLNLT